MEVCGYTIDDAGGWENNGNSCGALYGDEDTPVDELLCCDVYAYYFGDSCELLTNDYDYDCAGCNCPLDVGWDNGSNTSGPSTPTTTAAPE
jgi:hypothetical protein